MFFVYAGDGDPKSGLPAFVASTHNLSYPHSPQSPISKVFFSLSPTLFIRGYLFCFVYIFIESLKFLHEICQLTVNHFLNHKQNIFLYIIIKEELMCVFF